jgi:hypothetical protein
MKKYNFPINVYEGTDNLTIPTGEQKYLGQRNIIMYKCLICNCFTQEWDDTWPDEKKAQVKAEVDAHHNYHIIPDETNPTE